MRPPRQLPLNARRGSSHAVLACSRSSTLPTVLLLTHAQNSASVTHANVDFLLSLLLTSSLFRDAGDGVHLVGGPQVPRPCPSGKGGRQRGVDRLATFNGG